MLSKTLRAILENSADSSKRKQPSLGLLEEVWPTLVGEPLCHRTRPLEWIDGRLVVAAASQQWVTEMRRHRRRLERRIQARLPWEIERLEFRVADLPSAPPSADKAEQIDDTDASEALAELLPDEVRHELDGLDATTRRLLLRIGEHVANEE